MYSAVIDIGSNSLRLLLVDKRGCDHTVDAIEITRLAKGLKETGRLSEESMQESLQALKRFDSLIKQRAIRTVYAFCTEAVRAAANGEEFRRQIQDSFDWDVRIISGEEEAELGFIGSKRTFPGQRVVIDIGGASTEIVSGEHSLQSKKSYPIGALRYTEEPQADLREIFCDPLAQGTLVGIGGTITTALAMQRKLEVYERKLVQGQILTLEDLDRLAEDLSGLTVEEIAELPGIEPKRAMVIRTGIDILRHIMKQNRRSELIVSDAGNLEGYAESRGLC